MIEYPHYDKAIIVTSDGDFYSLVKYLYEHSKLKFVMSPYVKTCSKLLKKSAKEKIVFMDNLRKKLNINEKAPQKDGTLRGALSCVFCLQYMRDAAKSQLFMHPPDLGYGGIYGN